MFRKLKMRFARERDAKKIAELFRGIDDKSDSREIQKLIREKQVVIFHERKKIAGAFSFALLGMGLLSIIYIRKLAVEKKLRGRGIGSVALRKIKKFSTRQRAIGFFLWSRERAKNFYRKNRLRNLGRVFWWRR